MKRLAATWWLAFVGLQLPSCQFPSYSLGSGEPGGAGGAGDGGGGASGAGTSGSAGSGGAVTPPCGESELCQATVPTGWLGPVAFFLDKSGSTLPDCPRGYSDPTDLHADPEGAPAVCKCTCTAVDQACGTTDTIGLFGDLDCKNPCAEAGSTECQVVSGCSGSSVSIRADTTPPVGSCVEDVSKVVGPIAWRQDARLCELQSGDFDDCGADQACFPTPPSPFPSQLCVYRVMQEGRPAPECPDAYPNGPVLLFSSFEDERECGECTCKGPLGGACKGTVTVSTGDCSTTTAATTLYTIGSGCMRVENVKSVAPDYEMTPGACAVASKPESLGDVVPSGNFHAVCCP